MIKKMNRNFHFDLILSRSLDTDYYIKSELNKNIDDDEYKKSLQKAQDDYTIVLIRVENYEEGEVYYWTNEIFNNRFSMLNEIYEENEDKFNEGKEVDISKEDDPLWDQPKQSLIGYAFVSLKPCLYKVPLEIKTNVFSVLNSQKNATLYLRYSFLTENDEEYAQTQNPSLEELKDKKMKVKLLFEKVEELGEIYNSNIQIEYQGFGENDKRKFESDKKINKTAEINKEVIHEIIITSPEDFKYLNEESLIIKFFGVEKVNKQGKLAQRINLPIENLSLTHKIEESRVRSQTTTVKKDKKEKDGNCAIF